MNRGTLISLLAATSLFLGACNSADLESLCIGIGACDPPQPPPEEITVLCDYSTGSTCSRATLDTLVVEVFHYLEDRPGSVIDIWTLKQTVGQSQSVAQVIITPSQRSGRRAMNAHQQAELEEALNLIHRATEPYFRSPQPPRSRSPLIETLSKISFSRPNPDDSWRLIVISDALEYSDLLDGECAPAQDTLQFITSIENLGVLSPDSFQNAMITFAWVTLGEIDGSRCPLTIQSSRRVRQLWSSLLTWAGAESVRFESGLPNLDSLFEDHEEGNKGIEP